MCTAFSLITSFKSFRICNDYFRTAFLHASEFKFILSFLIIPTIALYANDTEDLLDHGKLHFQ